MLPPVKQIIDYHLLELEYHGDPPGVETQNTIWVSKNGDDSNSGFLEGDAKATVGAAAAW